MTSEPRNRSHRSPGHSGNRPSGRRGRSGRGAFLAAALRSPREVGTLLPSGRALARRLATVVPRTRRDGRGPVIVEIGAGEGAVTAELAERVGSGATLIAIERDPALADRLRARGLRADVVTADALTLRQVLAERGLDRADAIVSVLPWTLLPAARQRELLEVLTGVLHSDGVFTAAAYSLGYWASTARRFRGELNRVFREVVPTRTLWSNAPPAMTYVCRQPIR